MELEVRIGWLEGLLHNLKNSEDTAILPGETILLNQIVDIIKEEIHLTNDSGDSISLE